MNRNQYVAAPSFVPDELARIEGGAFLPVHLDLIEPLLAAPPVPGDRVYAPWPLWICGTPSLDF